MPFTEFATPIVKQDDESRQALLAAVPILATALAKAPGLKQSVFGNIVSENGVDV